ncbi:MULTISPECIES: sodium-translocating pyrophosphatase [unclassified Nocardioides]|uniref:sodium-translocating pyrophosphatase n=1 Tax=unclassified Nocardioides TaxID=2615069 RepID=UPI0007006783|nr:MULTISPECIES: sodium-translocating pyrophosphatase [unclassified Nocardioides]KRA29807.1 potassium transporter [Nocardioides sp. Root614]KRA86730.1 potassium transporter [Nocardioides sp. Root682]
MPRPLLVDVEVTGGDLALVIGVAVIALGSLGMGFLFRSEVLRAGEGTPNMQKIAQAVQEGANAYLTRQFRTLAIFAAIAFFVLLALPAHTGDDATGLQSEWTVRIFRSVFFLVGAGFSGAVGYLGMSLAVRANLRVAAAANEQGRDVAMNIGFRTGAFVGMFTVGLGLLGASVVVIVFQAAAPNVLEGFGFGAALLAMFMRVGGGIFTKAADVGADLVGKVEQGIPEDDPRNAATIADNVGDNVGDCAGMAADLFESYAVTLVAALILGSQAFGDKGLVFPLIVPAIGALSAIAGVYLTKPRASESGLKTINRAFYISAAVGAVASAAAAFIYLPTKWSELNGTGAEADLSPPVFAAGAVVIGIVLAAAILALTGYFTGTEHRPVKDVGKTSLTGAATVILAGLSVGFESAVYTAIVIGSAVFGAALLAGSSTGLALFAVALAGCGLLTTVGVIVAMDTFGPVSDNAQGIAEMSGDVSEEGAKILTELDAVGNTTKAITKGIAIATAVLAASALFASYTQSAFDSLAEATGVKEGTEDLVYNSFLVFDAKLIVGTLLGAAVVFLFSGLAINAVARAAGAVVVEVRRQFRDIPGIMEGTARPEYGKVVDIVTRDSLRELATPGILAILAPVAVGFGLGVGPLAGFLVGAIATGTLMAVFLANAGGAWDNAKKLVEDGNHGGKGSPAHEATIIGDTVGDPFKDTAGPSINPLLKVMNLVSLLIVGAIISLSYGSSENDVVRILIAAAAATGIIAAVYISKQRVSTIGEEAPAAVESV